MSRTYRRKSVKSGRYEEFWILRDSREEGDFNPEDVEKIEFSRRSYYQIYYKPSSKEGRKRLSKYHSDSGKYMNWNGPNWYQRLYVQKPYRRRSDRELQRFISDNEYEPMIESKPKRIYYY